jgi:hypothetical protein
MIIVGKIGKSKEFDPLRRLTSMETNWLTEEELREKYGRMWRDGSVYADETTCGVVRAAYFERVGERLFAVVQIDQPAGACESGGHEPRSSPK